MAEPFWGQLHRESEEPIVTITSGIGTHNQRAGPTQISEPDRRCIGHLGGKDIGEVLTELCIVEIAVVIDDEVETEFSCVVLQDVAHPLGACLGKVDGGGGYWSVNLLIGDRSMLPANARIASKDKLLISEAFIKFALWYAKNAAVAACRPSVLSASEAGLPI